MGTSVERSPWEPGYRWWAILVVVTATGLIANWAIAAGLLAFILVQVARPFDFLMAYLIVVAAASFIANAGGHLTFELSVLTGLILLMLACYALSNQGRVFSLQRTTLTWPLVLFLVSSLASAARGLLAGYSPKYWGLELMPLLALETALIVANAFEPRRDMRLAMVAMIGIAFAGAVRGFADFSVAHAHTVGGYTVAVPGIIGLMLVNLALRSGSRRATFGWVVLSMPLFVHQLITFGRGLWTGCLAGLLASLLIFAGIGRGSGARWRRAALVVAILAGLGLMGVLQAAIIFGQSDLLTEAGTRLTSITSTKPSYETRSNLIRLWEYGVVAKLLKKAPVFGYGIGFTFLGKEPFSGRTFYQWGVHQNFLLVWLKQGLIGLVMFVWMLWAAAALGVREARRRADPWEATWFSTIAVATIFLAVFSLSNYPFGEVNEMFLMALLWGGGMAMTRTGVIVFRWLPPQDKRGGQSPRDRA
jgi:hypothetical protein